MLRLRIIDFNFNLLGELDLYTSSLLLLYDRKDKGRIILGYNEELDKLIKCYILTKNLESMNVNVLFDNDAREYARANKERKVATRRTHGFTDIQSYFLNRDEGITVLIFNSKDRLVKGTIAHEMKHVEQLMNGKIIEHDKSNRYYCEKEAYLAGIEELRKHSWFKANVYRVRRWWEYKLNNIIRF